MRIGPDDVVVVTGGSAGIGRAVVRKLAERGCAIAVLARGQDGVDATVKEVEAAGGRGLGITVDVVDTEAVERAAEQVEQELGPITVWVNNAFAAVFAPFLDVTPEEFRRTTEVTYLGYVNGTRAALRRMVPRDRGTVVQVGSALAYRGIPLQAAYCGAKHAIQGFSESVRCELIHEKSKVRITEVHLPAVNTPQFSWVLSKLPKHPQPVPPIFQPEVAADGIVWAAEHPDRREYLVGGPTWATVTANKFVPGLLDRYLGWTGYASQQSDELPTTERPANLWQPVDGDQGAHGAFDSKAKERSYQLWLSQHRGLVTSVVAAGFGVAARALRSVTED